MICDRFLLFILLLVIVFKESLWQICTNVRG